MVRTRESKSHTQIELVDGEDSSHSVKHLDILYSSTYTPTPFG